MEKLELDEDWEEWNPSKGKFVHHMIAGSCAGMIEHVSVFPFDTIKTHMQCQRCPRSGTPVHVSATATAKALIQKEGFFRLFRGVSTMFSASIPAHAAYFSVFEKCKKMFGADGPHHAPIASGAAGVCATVIHDGIMTPMDVIKQRLQLGYYAGVADCFKSIVREEGFSALYISFPTTLLMNLPFGMVMVATNETLKKVLNPSGEHNVPAFMASGGLAGALAGIITNPLDVAKTRLQTQLAIDESVMACTSLETSASGVVLNVPVNCSLKTRKFSKTSAPHPHFRHQYHGLLDVLGQIKAKEGYAGFFRGVGPRLLVNTPSVAVSWTTYEVLKNFLHELDS